MSWSKIRHYRESHPWTRKEGPDDLSDKARRHGSYHRGTKRVEARLRAQPSCFWPILLVFNFQQYNALRTGRMRIDEKNYEERTPNTIPSNWAHQVR